MFGKLWGGKWQKEYGIFLLKSLSPPLPIGCKQAHSFASVFLDRVAWSFNNGLPYVTTIGQRYRMSGGQVYNLSGGGKIRIPSLCSTFLGQYHLMLCDIWQAASSVQSGLPPLLVRAQLDQNGRWPKWKTTKMEDDQNGRRPKWKTNKKEDDQNGIHTADCTA